MIFCASIRQARTVRSRVLRQAHARREQPRFVRRRPRVLQLLDGPCASDQDARRDCVSRLPSSGAVPEGGQGLTAISGRHSCLNGFRFRHRQHHADNIGAGRRNPPRSFLFNLKELFCACFARSNLYSAKEKLKIVSVRGGAAHFCPARPSRAKARRGMQFELFLKYTADEAQQKLRRVGASIRPRKIDGEIAIFSWFVIHIIYLLLYLVALPSPIFSIHFNRKV